MPAAAPHRIPAASPQASGLFRLGMIGLTLVGACHVAFSADSSSQKPSTKAQSPATHWSFQPVQRPKPPVVRDSDAFQNPVDAFIDAQRRTKGLSGADIATRTERIRRLYLDVTGLPPTPDCVATFVADTRPNAWERAVETVLASPRYGERWAQHWLDVVRYADTHGFEVNTERPNAWPYRDYVIRAFNEDRPYNQFIRDQIAGDLYGEDAGTGFLVASAVLLPGQIGADDASKRLARQDALSEIVGATSQVFLGLSVGCARCHNHKFDPIPQSDYYALQAFFAGVEYSDRPIRTSDSDRRLRDAEALRPKLVEVEQSLATFEPLARPNPGARTATQARWNELRFPPVEARFVRFTIHDASLHPNLGLIEPCIDEFEIYAANAPSNNIALASHGTRVSASGSRTSGSHRLEHINDGRYGNAHSWMSDEAGRGWVQFELPAAQRIDRVVWSRDRDAQFEDRLATAFTLEAGPDPDSLRPLSHVPPLRPAVHPQKTVDRFPPIATRRVRMVIEATSNLEPCLDEFEVIVAAQPTRNVALASNGAIATASGSMPGSDQHKLEHLNDGRYGNGHSWMSNEPGKGWVEIRFAQQETIDRVIWSRDREGSFTDRLPTLYRIDVEAPDGRWQTVASNSDRAAYAPGSKPASGPLLAALPPAELKTARELLNQKKRLSDRIASLSAVPMVFGGAFRNPDTTRMLYRGDPEQPREEIAPKVLSVLGTLSLPKDAPDAERRRVLADWIAQAENPLTARVMVNRVWQGHFGVGFVETSSDFGTTGTAPTHPELLDWLASELIESGWSLKHLHRLILTSATYQQSNKLREPDLSRDRESRYLWRFPTRRLEAEPIRDTVLQVSGHLNLGMGGPGFNLFKSRGGLDGFPPIETFDASGRRRLIYAHKVRMEREIVFGAFDCPDAGLSTTRRRQSTTPIQALNLLNSRFMLDEADAFAARVESDLGKDAPLETKITRVFQLAYARPPTVEELQATRAVVASSGLSPLCRAVFNSNEFLFIP